MRAPRIGLDRRTDRGPPFSEDSACRGGGEVSAGFDQRFDSLSRKVERFLLRAVLAGLVLVVAAQVLLSDDSGRSLFSYVDRLEGATTAGGEDLPAAAYVEPESGGGPGTGPMALEDTAAGGGEYAIGPVEDAIGPTTEDAGGRVPGREHLALTIMLVSAESAADAAVVVNGRRVAYFEGGKVKVAVEPGDLVELDAADVANELTFRVVAASPSVTKPELGTELTTRGTIEMLGEVRVAEGS